MRLSRLTLLGFKSFAEKVEIAFEPGITAIVGPNGCGKSNISDAIRWALGEQSAKLLRGDRMDDLIFVGTGKRHGTAMAEVTLTFTDNTGDLPTDYEEVLVTRRLYRSGESEYLLNNTPCRLRDITDLFIDTGLVGEPYALIEQGSITTIINSHPQDLRALLDEAAGIMKYKIRRRAAVSKLQATEQNLLRLQDILRELEHQRASLKRQAHKAERYQALQEKATALRVYLRYREGSSLHTRLLAAEGEEARWREKMTAHETQLATREVALEALRLREAEADEGVWRAHEALYGIRNRLTQEESALTHSTREQQEITGRREEGLARRAELLHRIARLEEEKETARQRLTECDAELERLEAEMRRLGTERDESTRVLAEAVHTQEEGRRRTIQQATRLADTRNALLRAEDRLGEIQRQQEKGQSRRAEISAQIAQIRERIQGLTEELRACEGESDERRTAVADLRASVSRLREERDRCAQDLQALREGASRTLSRLEALQDLRAAYEGYGEGSRILLQKKQAGDPRLESVRSPLVDLVRTSPRFEKALEALLGATVEGLVAASPTEALAALTTLQEESPAPLGRTIFIVPWEGQPSLPSTALRDQLSSLSPPLPGILGLAPELIQVSPADRRLFVQLLSEAVVVSDMTTALALATRLTPPFRIATLAGDLLTSRGLLMTGEGSSSGSPRASGGLLARGREMEELREESAAYAPRIHTRETEWQALGARVTEEEERLTAEEESLHRRDIDRLAYEKDIARLQGDCERLEREATLLDLERREHATEEERLRETLAAFRQDLMAQEEEERTRGEKHRQGEERVTTLRNQHDLLDQGLTEVRLRVTSTSAQQDAREREIARAGEDLTAARGEVERLSADGEALAAREKEIATALLRLQSTLTEGAEEERRAQTLLTEAQERRAHLQAERTHLEEETRLLRREAADLQSEMNRLAAQKAEAATTLQLLGESLREEYGIPWASLEAEFSHDTRNPDEVSRELDDLRRKIGEMGPTNVAALEEFTEVNQRYTFLATQAEDLRASLHDLRSVIAEINRTIAKLFRDTLGEINSHFDRLWKRLFSGGSAEVRLEEAASPTEGAETPPEEPGIELHVRIPGKRPVPLSLLSGGERTLAALAFLLALFSVRPSPFCLLDEVDAPLDDANVERFVALMKELSTQAQFIVITHNKRTMEAADLLYGVTMAEEGVSSVISVCLKDAA